MGLSGIGLFAATGARAAMTPTLSLSSAGGDSALVSVFGDPNASVVFYYNVASGSGMRTVTLGTTNSSGYFSMNISASSYGINTGQSAYVIVNGQQSAMQVWPAPTGTPTLSQTSVTLGIGQSVTLYSQGSSAPVYTATNSNPSAVSMQTNGTQITVRGNQTGSATATICYTGTASNCGTLYVTVNNNPTSGSLYFSTSNPNIALGQTITVTISGGSGYYVTGNSNPSVAAQTLSGNVVTISGIGNGSDMITVCSASNGCGSIYATVGASSSTGNVMFGVVNPALTIGQSFNLSLSGGSSYYVSSNANSAIAQASVNGNSLVLYGESAGSDAITVCASGSGCNTLYATVSGTLVPTASPASASSLLSAIQSIQNQLSQIVTQVQSMANTLSRLAASMGTRAPALNNLNANPTTTATTSTSASPAYTFTEFLNIGSQDAEVTALQEKLSSRGFYSGTITGFYGPLTESAVKAYQTAHGIEATGYVGPNTRMALNIGE